MQVHCNKLMFFSCSCSDDHTCRPAQQHNWCDSNYYYCERRCNLPLFYIRSDGSCRLLVCDDVRLNTARNSLLCLTITLTLSSLWRQLLPYGYNYEASYARPAV